MRTGPGAQRIVVAGSWISAAALVAVPLACGIGAIRAGWTAISDQAVIAARSLDTLTAHPPLVGMPTSLSVQAGRNLYHPGPLPFWIFALPARLLGEPGYGLVAATAMVNVAALATIIALVRRARGPGAAMGAAIVLAGALHSFGGRSLRDPFNPFVAVLPLLVLIFATWCVLARHPKAILPAVLFGSFAAQAHVLNLIIFVGLGLLCIAILVFDWRRSPVDGQARRAITRWSAGSLVALIACWSGPIIDQVAGNGNMLGLVRSGGDVAPAGLRFGVGRLLNAIAPVPRWVTSTGTSDTTGHVRGAIGLIMLATLVALGAWALRSGRRCPAGLMATAVATAALGAGTASRLPADVFSTASPSNNLQWLPVSVIVWFALGVGLAVLAGDVASRASVLDAAGGAAGRVVALAPLALVPLVLFWSIATVVGDHVPDDPGSVLFAPIRTHAGAIERSMPSGDTAILAIGEHPPPAAYHYLTSLVGQLRLRNVRVRYAKGALAAGGSYDQYRETGKERGAVVMLIRSGPAAAAPLPGYRRISYYDPAHPPARYRGYDQSLFYAGMNPSAIFMRTGR